MAILSVKVRTYLEANSKTWNDERDNILIQNDGDGAYIKTWNVSGLAEPTESQLNALDSDGDASVVLRTLQTKRKHEYGDIGDQLDLLYKDMLADKGDKTGEWFKAIKKVKDDNPKS